MRPCNIETSHTNLPVTQRHIPEEMRPPSQTNYTFIYIVTTLPFPLPSLSRTTTDVSKHKSFHCFTSMSNCILDSFKSVNSPSCQHPPPPVHFLLYFPPLHALHKTDSCNCYIRFHSIVLHHECKSQPQSTGFS